jgi:tRNA uridine 5-carboxymethylaminomethyl modification enzyme
MDSKEEFVLDRSQAYIGVLVDDLISRGAPEPYRMFTSRAEYRLILRADNADQRLTPLGIKVGCIGEERAAVWAEKEESLRVSRETIHSLSATPNELQKFDLHINQDGVRRTAFDLLRYPNIEWADVVKIWPQLSAVDSCTARQIEIDALYAAYMERHQADIDAFKKDEALRLPEALDYDKVGSLSNEVRQKLKMAQPETLGAASRIPGVTPAAVVALLRFVKRKGHRDAA